MIPVTAFYAGLLGLMFFWLSIRTANYRRQHRIAFADGGDKELLSRIRAQGNFAEYVPIILLLLAIAEWHRASVWIVHAIGGLLLAGRLLHAYSLLVKEKQVTAGKADYRFRMAGMMLTFAAMILGSCFALYIAYAGFVLV